MGRWKIKTQPATEPVTLAEAKAHLNIPADLTDWDSLITRQVESARQYVEDYCGICLITQTISEYEDEFPCDYLELSRGPVSTITHVKYTNAAGTLTLWDIADYVADKVSKMARIAPKPGKTWPVNDDSLNSIEIEYVAGFGDADAVPAIYKDAILLTVGHLFENREDTVHSLPTKVINMLTRKANWQF